MSEIKFELFENMNITLLHRKGDAFSCENPILSVKVGGGSVIVKQQGQETLFGYMVSWKKTRLY